ncbi:MAG: hypothetical protein FDX18_03940 [Chlorobium sp.]|nr:MAG: hypothetical protein FDX18_03940 [Chlorobium sp.]
MDNTSPLHFLKSISEPILVDGGYWKHGHWFFIASEAGLYTVDCRVYDPLLGPIEFSLEQYQEIAEIAKECETLSENKDLDPDEKLFLFNGGQPDIEYWAFQPHDDAALEEYTFSADKKVVEQAFIRQALQGVVEPWEKLPEKSLIDWAEKIALHGALP